MPHQESRMLNIYPHLSNQQDSVDLQNIRHVVIGSQEPMRAKKNNNNTFPPTV